VDVIPVQEGKGLLLVL